MMLLLALPAAGQAAASEPSLLLSPTPLVLKDGRIARVSVHTVPFELGADRPAQGTQATLDQVIAELATDCFLTAQAIGHVEPGPDRDGETLAAHRLARARSEGIQATLTGHGLPAKSIAAVWDWQFAVREPRVTLWAFQLNAGDDCDGEPLGPAAAAEVASEGAVPWPDVAVFPSDPPPGPETTGPAEAEIDEAEIDEAEIEVTGIEAVEEGAAEPTAEDLANLALAAPEPELPALPPQPVAAEAEAFPEPLSAPPETVVAAPSPPPAKGDASAEPFTVTFDTNSSFFPGSIATQLKALAGGLDDDAAYEVALEASVSAGPAGDGGAAGSRDYDIWLAERRMSRVSEVLERNAGSRAISFQRRLVDGDPSRRVVLRIRRLP